MSVLTDAVVARVGNDRIVQLTNKDDPSATTVNSTMLATAADDAVAEFEIKAGETFDDSDAHHIRLVVPGVLAFLTAYNGLESGSMLISGFANRCEEYRKTRANRRIQPLCDRTVGPTPDVDSDGSGRRPEFDAPRFDRLNVVPPGDSEE